MFTAVQATTARDEPSLPRLKLKAAHRIPTMSLIQWELRCVGRGNFLEYAGQLPEEPVVTLILDGTGMRVSRPQSDRDLLNEDQRNSNEIRMRHFARSSSPGKTMIRKCGPKCRMVDDCPQETGNRLLPSRKSSCPSTRAHALRNTSSGSVRGQATSQGADL